MNSQPSILQRCHAFKDLREADLSGEDLTKKYFVDADLRSADLSGCTGRDVDFRCARLDGAIFSRVLMDRWDFTGASLKGAVLVDTSIDEHTNFRGADLSDITWKDVTFEGNGWKTYGTRLSTLPLKQIHKAYDSNLFVARLVDQEVGDDPDFANIARFMVGLIALPVREKLICWEGFALHMHRCFPQRVNDLERLFLAHPTWKLYERWQLAQTAAYLDLDGLVGLKKSRWNTMFGRHIQSMIRKAKRKADSTSAVATKEVRRGASRPVDLFIGGDTGNPKADP